MSEEIVINTCYGSFGLSQKAMSLYYAKKGKKIFFFDIKGELIIDQPLNARLHSYFDKEKTEYASAQDIPRDGVDLISVVEELGDEANGWASRLEIIEIPDDVKYWHISDYDGKETVQEPRRSWGCNAYD